MQFKQSSMYLFAGNTDFVIAKKCKLDNVEYQPGDTLSPQASVRNNPRRLELLCRLHHLKPRMVEAATLPKLSKPSEPATAVEEGLEPVVKKKKKKHVETKEKRVVRDYESMTKPKLRAILKKRELPYRGLRRVLIARLQKSDEE